MTHGTGGIIGKGQAMVEVSDEDIVELHSLRNDGCSLSFIRTYKFPELSAVTIRRILDSPVPPHLRDNPRCAPERWIWVSIETTYPGTEHGKAWPLVLLRYPLPITQKAFRGAFRALGRAVREETGLEVSKSSVFEALDGKKDAERLIAKGVMAWQVDRAGTVSRTSVLGATES